MSERNTYVFMASRVFTREFEVEADSYEEACGEAQEMVFGDGERDFVDSLTDHPERTEVSYSGYYAVYPDGAHPTIGYPDSDGGSERLDADADGEHCWPRLLYRRWEGDDEVYGY